MSDLEELQSTATKELIKFFKGTKAVRKSPDAIKIARLAISSLSNVARIKATDRARDGVQLAVLSGIAQNKEEFQNMVSVSLPSYDPKPLLPRPKD